MKKEIKFMDWFKSYKKMNKLKRKELIRIDKEMTLEEKKAYDDLYPVHNLGSIIFLYFKSLFYIGVFGIVMKYGLNIDVIKPLSIIAKTLGSWSWVFILGEFISLVGTIFQQHRFDKYILEKYGKIKRSKK